MSYENKNMPTKESMVLSGRPSIWNRLTRNHLTILGMVMVSLICIIALAAPILPLADPNATNLLLRLVPPFTPGHILGTDQLGRDILSRLVWGARVSLAVGVLATLIAAVIGSFIGLVAGFFHGWRDNVLMRGIDMIMAFPYMLLALAIVAVLGSGLLNALYAISIVNIPFFARNVRGVTVGLVRREYVDAARLSGLSNSRILSKEILPNVLPVIIITISTTVGWMILETAGLSFLGLGAQPPQADLGSMLGDGRKLVITAPHVATIPGLVILFLVIGINLVGDGLRDALDPRLKSGAMVRPMARTEVVHTFGANEEMDSRKKDSQTLLDVQDLKTSFQIGRETYQAVNGVDFFLQPADSLGIVGESGSGKSVTALSVLGLVPTPPGRIVGGQIHYRSENLLEKSLPEIQRLRGNRIAYVFQDPLTTLNPLFPVGEQIAETIEVHQGLSRGKAMEKAVEMMDMVHIPKAKSRAGAYPHELSGGMRQRIVISMALANDPEVIIADEPTTALDVTIQAQILRLLDELRREKGSALLFITHDFGVVDEVCDRVMVMYSGRVVESGTTRAVFENPLHPYTHRLMACVPRLGEPDRTMNAIPGMAPAVNRLPQGCAFAPRCDLAVDDCRRHNIELQAYGSKQQVRCLRAGEVEA